MTRTAVISWIFLSARRATIGGCRFPSRTRPLPAIPSGMRPVVPNHPAGRSIPWKNMATAAQKISPAGRRRKSVSAGYSSQHKLPTGDLWGAFLITHLTQSVEKTKPFTTPAYPSGAGKVHKGARRKPEDLELFPSRRDVGTMWHRPRTPPVPRFLRGELREAGDVV